MRADVTKLLGSSEGVDFEVGGLERLNNVE